MKPVKQTRLNIPDVQSGNCWPACVASLLEIPIDDVPPPPLPGKSWAPYWRSFRSWAARRGLALIEVAGDSSFVEASEGAEALYWIATGRSPRGVRHSVVMRGAKMVHDPHPSDLGVEDVDTISLFVPLDLGRVQIRE